MLQCLCTIWLNAAKNYSKTSGTLWNYYKNISDPLINSESFKYKTSNTGKTGKGGNTKEVSLKHLSNFWRTLDMPLDMTWSKNCILTDMKTRDV